MKRFNLLIVMAAFMTMLVWARPAVQHVRINGVDLEGMKGKIYAIPVGVKPQFLNGVICANPNSLDNVGFEIAAWKGADGYTLTHVVVNYLNKERPDEHYVVTYKREGGVIDAVLAYEVGDIGYGSAPFLLWEYNYTLLKNATELTLNDESEFTVKRSYKTIMEERGGPQLREIGDWTKKYFVDAKGLISIGDETWKTRTISTPNESVIDNPDEPREWVGDMTETLSLPMLDLVKLYSTPLSDKNEPEQYEALLQYDPKGNGYAQEESLRLEAMKRFKNDVTEWQKRLIYRQPMQWVEWIYNNQESKCALMLKDQLKADPDFKTWLTAQVKNAKNKKMLKWWNTFSK